MQLIISRRVRRFALVAIGLYVLVQAACGGLFYWSPEQRVRIVDLETRQPVAGAVVMTLWIGQVTTGSYHLLHGSEAVTDSTGWCRIQPMLPHLRPPLVWMSWSDPKILVFKAGYFPNSADNSSVRHGSALHNTYRHVSVWNGRSITLRKVHDQGEARSAAEATHEMFWYPDARRDRSSYPQTWRAVDAIDGIVKSKEK